MQVFSPIWTINIGNIFVTLLYFCVSCRETTLIVNFFCKNSAVSHVEAICLVSMKAPGRIYLCEMLHARDETSGLLLQSFCNLGLIEYV